MLSMNGDLLVIIGCSVVKGWMPTYVRQLSDAGIAVHIEMLTDETVKYGGSSEFVFKDKRRLAERFANYKKLIFSDGWDVLFFGTREEVIRKIPNDYVLLAAERNCWPKYIELDDKIEGPTAWRYANGGLLAGTPENIIVWLDALMRHSRFNGEHVDQYLYNLLLYDRSELLHIDDHTELFYCALKEQEELQFENELPVNTACATHPQFIHANGCFDMGVILKRMSNPVCA